MKRTCERPKPAAGQGARSAVWRARQATRDTAVRPVSGVPLESVWKSGVHVS
ncbi:hypothetical protein K788_0008002 [Paraburkholderia caribensis MBA4]|uniref:Uncharacterized protein n=1 Tax=Paraburkholderia caribensis MBA4 TaxID=1323664 RepID=A0A0P0R5E9_9BURK|nr:hypothetical protein K788_0008002 [Paraburkholderia caribensis MBA4]